MAAEKTQEQEERETGRLEAFSDGIFAFAITLLIFVIKVPTVKELEGDVTLAGALFSQWPAFMAYLISFFTVLIMWVQHRRLFTMITRTDVPFLYLNALLLLVVTFVPFPTAILGTYIRGEESRTAALIYTGTHIMIGIVFNLVWHYAAYKRKLIGRNISQRAVDAVNSTYWLGPIVYTISFLLCFVHVWLGLTTCVLLDIYFAIDARSRIHED